MKQVYFLFFAILLTGSAYGQMDVTLTPERGEVISTADATDIASKIQLTNNTESSMRLGWRAILDGLPVDWQGWVCDSSQCYTTFTYASPEFAPVIVAPGETVALEAHVRPNDVPGNGFFTLQLFDLDRPSETVQSLDYEFMVQDARAFDRTTATRIRMYPNPTTNFIQLENDWLVDEIHVYNIIGRPILKLPRVEGKKYDLSRLPGGMYMVSLVSKNYGVLRTIRLSKQVLRP